jgi:hypothetical protein
MFIDTMYSSEGAMVLIALEDQHERQFSDEHLISIACSQDLLTWDNLDREAPVSHSQATDRLRGWQLVTCPKGRKLRGPSPGERATVHMVGNAVALVMLRDRVPAASEQ